MLDRTDSLMESPAGSADRHGNACPSAGASAPDARIEDYLDHVCAPLVGRVPYARRQELRAELRSHLEALVATHEELGSTRDAAVALALRQFGPPRCLSHQWAREWAQGISPAGVQPVRPALLIALGSFGAATALALALMAMGLTIGASGLDDGLWYAVMGVVGIVLPTLAGLATGLLAPARQALGTFFALALLILPSAALALHALAQPGPGGDNSLSLGLAMAQSVLWMPIGCTAAALGGWLRDSLVPRPRNWALH